MFLSKIWFFLTVAAAAVALSLAFLVLGPSARETQRTEALSLDRVQLNTELMLQLDARRWIDLAVEIGRDRSLVELLEQAQERKDEVKRISHSVAGRLRTLTKSMKDATRPSLLIVMDAEGKQIARIGPGEESFTPGASGLTGYPLVEHALRGFQRDDSWSLDGALLRMVGAPVVSRAKGRYMGALLLGRAVDAEFAKSLKNQLGGADILFFLRGKLLAATTTSAALSRLPLTYDTARQQISKDGRSAAITVGDLDARYSVIMAPIVGEANYHDAFYAVVTHLRPAEGLGAVLKKVDRSDMAWGSFPWPLVLGCLLAILVVGIGLMGWEIDLPLRRLVKCTGELARGEETRLKDRSFSGKLGSIARFVNSALDRAERRAPPATSTKDLSSVLGAASGSGAVPSLRPDPSFAKMPRHPSSPLSAAPSFGAVDLSQRANISLEDIGGAVDLSPSIDGPFGGGPEPDEARLPPVPKGLGLEVKVLRTSGQSDGKSGDSKPAGPPPLLELDTPVRPMPPPSAPRLSLQADEPVGPPALEMPVLAKAHSPSGGAGHGGASGGANPANKIRIPDAADDDDNLPAHSTLPPLGASGEHRAPNRAALSEDPPPSRAPAPRAPARPLMPTPVAAMPPLAPPPAPPRDHSGGPAQRDPFDDASAALADLAAPAPSGAGPQADDDDLSDVFASFLAVKQQCGESTDNLTIDKFAAKLAKNREALMTRYHCKRVKFQVYIKDGKAAIKATPVRE